MTNSAPHALSAADEERMVESDHTAATNHYAGPFCGCGDYSCPANDNDNARCVNNDHFVPVEFTYDLD
ncbi:hypothetical protein [Williamsia muralis]|uniref:hypothetical protein n=1 Tax=Williamsia marianensis TaxID=85044 RepID=UPI0037F65796